MVRPTHLINSGEKVAGRSNGDAIENRQHGLEKFLAKCTLVANRAGAGVFPETELLDRVVPSMFGDRGVGNLTAEEVAELVYR